MKLRLPKWPKARVKKPAKPHVHRQRCNLCHGLFRAASKFVRFCRTCRHEEDVYRFAEWLGV